MTATPFRTLWLRTLARQLGSPSGLLGSVVVRQLNQRNARSTARAVAALRLEGGETVADIGYGGGVGLRLLLDAVGQAGRVHGVEPSGSMIERAGKQFRGDLASGRLSLHGGTMNDLPLETGGLDGWISVNTIYFIEDLGPSFAELARVLSPTGRGALGVADPDWLARQPFAEHGFTVRPLAEVVEALGDAGLDVTVETETDEDAGAGYHVLVCRHRPAQ